MAAQLIYDLLKTGGNNWHTALCGGMDGVMCGGGASVDVFNVALTACVPQYHSHVQPETGTCLNCPGTSYAEFTLVRVHDGDVKLGVASAAFDPSAGRSASDTVSIGTQAQCRFADLVPVGHMHMNISATGRTWGGATTLPTARHMVT